MSDWFTFHIDERSKVVTIEIDAQILLENQPQTYDEADDVCTDVLIPIVDILRETCVEKGYKQNCIVDLYDVDVTLMSPTILVRMICNIYEHTKDKPENLINEFKVTNSNALFRGAYKLARNLLPEYMKSRIFVS